MGISPYIKVSDLRAGLVNVNSTNMVSRNTAKRFWKGKDSGLNPYDIITPARACKNIGEIVVLLPGQEDIVLTKEVLIFAPTEKSDFDSFYLAWALDLPEVNGNESYSCKRIEKMLVNDTGRLLFRFHPILQKLRSFQPHIRNTMSHCMK